VGHHQVCLEVKSYKVHEWGGARSRYVGSYLWIALGNLFFLAPPFPACTLYDLTSRHTWWWPTWRAETCSVVIRKNRLIKLCWLKISLHCYYTTQRGWPTSRLLYMFRVSQHPSSGVSETVPAASGTGYTTCTEGSSGTSSMTCTGGFGYSFWYSWWWVLWHPKHVE